MNHDVSNMHTIEQIIRAEQMWLEALGTGYDSIITDVSIYERLFA